MIVTKLTGEWEKARTILNNAGGVLDAIDYAVKQEAQHARREIVKGMTKQEPGGKKFLPLAPTTIATRRFRKFGGSKALLVTAALRNSITVTRAGPGMMFVGVLRSAKRPDGKQLFNIARVHEEGQTMVIPTSPKMIRLLMAIFRQSGVKRKSKALRKRLMRHFSDEERSGVATGVIVVRVPPRPFIRPVIEEILRHPIALQERMTTRVAYRLKLALGKP